ncbi:hypothetical protein Har1131_05290 [Haloarcula sp. CBA1131]|nr:hypothetical protein Har1131_05290 [Haloarcula sp. CBA1131]
MREEPDFDSETIEQMVGAVEDLMPSGIESFSNYIYANSWHINENESDAMWKIYSHTHEGLAIQTTVGNLREALNSEYDMKIGEVQYIDWNQASGFVMPIQFAFLKRPDFAHERELRACYVNREELEKVDGAVADYDHETPIGEYIGVSVPKLIDKIYTSPKSPNWFHEMIKMILDTYDIDAEVRKSGVYKKSHSA